MAALEKARTALEIGERALIVAFVLSAFNANGQEGHDWKELLRLAASRFGPGDRDLFAKEHWPPELCDELYWQCESLHVLLWSVHRAQALMPMDRQVPAAVVIGELNLIGRAPSVWRDTLVRRSDEELDRVEQLVDVWLWRTTAPVAVDAQNGEALGHVRESIEHAVARGALPRAAVRDGDLVALGRPLHQLAKTKRDDVARIVRERARAVRWIWKDFDDWWDPLLDT